jgi:hypothetical protein
MKSQKVKGRKGAVKMVNLTLGVVNKRMGARRKRAKEENWASKPNSKAQDLLGPLLRTPELPESSTNFNEHFFFP